MGPRVVQAELAFWLFYVVYIYIFFIYLFFLFLFFELGVKDRLGRRKGRGRKVALSSKYNTGYGCERYFYRKGST